LLDFIGSEHKLRKPVGTDFRNGKPSIVTVRLYEAPGTTRVRLSERTTMQLRKARSSEEIVTGVEQLIAEYAERALAAIEDLHNTPAKRCLVHLGRSISARDC
jgi:geranylgeranyl pyrophosphate synthase